MFLFNHVDSNYLYDNLIQIKKKLFKELTSCV
jgi:hypothetical protein